LIIDMVIFCHQDHKSIIYDSKLLPFALKLNPKLADLRQAQVPNAFDRLRYRAQEGIRDY